MSCYVCYQNGISATAIALCKNCMVALCMDHLLDAQRQKPGGTDMGCDHLALMENRLPASPR